MLARWVTVAGLFAGVTGGIVGLVVGLFVYGPTAPFAAVEVGFPAAFAGGVIGLVVAAIMAAVAVGFMDGSIAPPWRARHERHSADGAAGHQSSG